MYSHSVHSAAQTVRTTQSRIEQVYWQEHRHYSQLLSGEDWQESIKLYQNELFFRPQLPTPNFAPPFLDPAFRCSGKTHISCCFTLESKITFVTIP